MSSQRYTRGFLFGMIVGTVALVLLIPSFNNISFPFQQQTVTLDALLIVIFAMLAMVFGIGSGIRNGRVMYSRKVDGFVFGFAIVFDVIGFIVKLVNHQSLL